MAEIDVLTEETAQKILGGIHALSAVQRIYLKKWATDSWDAIFEIGRSGYATHVFKVGDQFTMKYTINGTEYDCTWDLLGFKDCTLADGTVYTDVPIIQMHYTNHENIVFDAQEREIATEETALANTYYVGTNDNSSFTMLSYSEGQTIDYSAYTYIYHSSWNSTNPANRGANDWMRCFARQYLNASGTGWAKKMHDYDVLPSNASTMVGFLDYLPEDFTSKLSAIKVQTMPPSYIGSSVEVTYDKMWLLSVSEMNMKDGNASVYDGDPFEFYKELLESETKVPTGTYSQLIKYAINAKTSARGWWLRSAGVGSYGEWLVGSSGYVYGGGYPCGTSRLAPACALC